MGNRLCKRCRDQSDGPTKPDGPIITFPPIDNTPPPPTPQPTPPFPDNRAKVVVAVYSYEARTDDDLSFEKGDQLEIRDNTGDWWFARDRKLGKKGYIPCNYVAPTQSLEAEQYVLIKFPLNIMFCLCFMLLLLTEMCHQNDQAHTMCVMDRCLCQYAFSTYLYSQTYINTNSFIPKNKSLV